MFKSNIETRKGAMQTCPIKIHSTTGDIFDVRQYGLQGVALFVPGGLTSFRTLASEFIKTYGISQFVSGSLEVFRVESNDVSPLIRIVYVANPGHKSFVTGEIGSFVEQTFAAFEDAGCRTIGMNGFRIEGDNRSRNQFRSEQETLDTVRQWVYRHPRTTIEDIYLVDKRGGFEHTT